MNKLKSFLTFLSYLTFHTGYMEIANTLISFWLPECLILLAVIQEGTFIFTLLTQPLWKLPILFNSARRKLTRHSSFGFISKLVRGISGSQKYTRRPIYQDIY